MLHNEDILIENIKKKGNRVLIWGACERNNDILAFFRQNNVNVVGYIDQNADVQSIYNDLPVFNKDIIRNDDYFVYVGLLKTYDEVISYLEENNYNEFVDYWYPCREVVLDGSHSYKDLYGNEYVGKNYNIKIKLSNNSRVFIDRNCMFDSLSISVHDVSELKLEKQTILKGNVHIGLRYFSMITISENVTSNTNLRVVATQNSKILLGKDCMFDSLSISVYDMSELKIEKQTVLKGNTHIIARCFSIIAISENVTSTTNLRVVAIQNSKISLGKDCMFARDVVVRAGNSHNIFNLEKGYNLTQKGYSVVIGNHVWVGERAVLFNGCEIGSGSIVGINTFVNKKFPQNCSIAGNPARIIKENIAWRREVYPYFNSYEDFSEFDFR